MSLAKRNLDHDMWMNDHNATQQFYAVRLNGDDLHGPFLRREAAESLGVA